MAPALFYTKRQYSGGRVIMIKFFDMLARENNTRVLNISLIVTEFTSSNGKQLPKLKVN